MRLHHRPGRAFGKLLCAICCSVALLCPLSSTADNQISDKRPSCSDASPIIFGILPFISAEQLVTRFSLLAHYLSVNLHVPIRIETAPNFVEFARRTNVDKRYDILFTAPHFYPQANHKGGYRLLVSVDSPGMWAVIVTPKQSKIYKIEDLSGKRLATVHPSGLATLLVRKHLADAGIDPDVDITMVSTPSHNASLLSSYHGVTDASALMSPPYEAFNPSVKNNMRIIAKTESTPHIPISVSHRISDDCAHNISELLLNMNMTETGRVALNMNRFSGFKKANPEDYERMKDLLAK